MSGELAVPLGEHRLVRCPQLAPRQVEAPVAGKRLRRAIRSQRDDADERAGTSDLADLVVRGRTAGPAHPMAARRFQRAVRSGGALES